MQSNYYLGGGVGFAKTELNAFDAALLSAKVGNFNLVKISSILPPYAIKKSSVSVQLGAVLHTAYATLLCDKQGQVISSGIGIAIPNDRSLPGVIMEYSSFHEQHTTRQKLQEMLITAMNIRGIIDYSTDYFVIDTVVNDFITCTFSCVSIW